MLRTPFCLAALLLTGFCTSSIATAQPLVPGGGVNRPVFSPYLNMLRGGNAALNYFGAVLPLQQYDQAVGRLQNTLTQQARDINQLEQGVGVVGISGFLPITGNVASFDNLGGYFDRIGGGAAAGVGIFGMGGGGNRGMMGAQQGGLGNRGGSGGGQRGFNPGGAVNIMGGGFGGNFGGLPTFGGGMGRR